MNKSMTDQGAGIKKMAVAETSDELREFFRHANPKVRYFFLDSAQGKTSEAVQITLEELIAGPDKTLGLNQITLRNMIINKVIYGRSLGRKFQFTKDDEQMPKDDLAKKVVGFWLGITI